MKQFKKNKKYADFFNDYEAEISTSIKRTLRKISTERLKRKFISFNNYPLAKIQNEIHQILIETFDQQGINLRELKLELPPPHIEGDIALSAFPISKTLDEKPELIAEKIVRAVKDKKDLEIIENAAAFGAFINFKINSRKLYSDILFNINRLGEQYGQSDINSKKVVLIDYSAPNIAKPIGVGHLRSTIIGQALANLYHATGYSVIKDNHLGDWGTQFGALIYAYEKWGTEEKIELNPLEKLKDLYVRFHQEAEKDLQIKEEARFLFRQLELKDAKMISYWKRFRDLSIVGFNKIYKKLGIKFDTYIGESYFVDQSGNIIDECLNKEICKSEMNTKAIIVDSLNGLPSFLLRKQDGSTLYLTRDLATLKFRVNTFHPDCILYVAGEEQKLHFQQLFALYQKIFDSEEVIKHIDFGMVLREGKKMSTRRGTVVELESLVSQSIAKAQEIIVQKSPHLKGNNLDKISEIIGIGAILYNDLSQSRIKNISFDWERMLDFKGGSAVYLQYTFVRIVSILRKIKKPRIIEEFKSEDLEGVVFEKQIEFALAKKLMFFPCIVINAQMADSAHVICTYAEELAQLFNNFYNEISIINTEDIKLKKSRIMLIRSVALVIKISLNLLNIKVPSKM